MPPSGSQPRSRQVSHLAALDRSANRAAQFLLPVLGFAFWLALIVVVSAAGLGWRPALR